MTSVLVLRGGALGDFIVTLPALRLLRTRWPAARIEFVGNAPAAQLALAEGLIDIAHSQHESRWAALHDSAPLPDELNDWLDRFDLVLNFWSDPDGTLAAHFPLRADQKFLTAAAHPALAPAARHYCAPLRSLDLTTDTFAPALTFAATSREQEIILHPGSGSPRKNWPIDRWRELARHLRDDRGASLAIVTGDAEAPDLLAAYGTPLRNLPLPELARRLARAKLFLGHDSGVSHLAAAVGTPSLLLFGPTDPAMWAPPGPHVRTLRSGETLDVITVATVRTALPQ